MATMNRYDHGQFSWVDLMAPDTKAATDFYTSLFGWTYLDFPTDQGGVYTQFKSRDLPVAGLGQLPDDMKATGIPGFWTSYVTVDDADAVAATATELGGTITMPVMDVMTAGRMAFLADLEGAHFAIWQPGEHAGAGLVNEPVSFAWNELLTKDLDAAKAFYSALFGWEITADNNDGIEYYAINNAGRLNAGILPWSSQMGEVPPNWGVYFSVADCDGIVARIDELGGRLIVPPRDIEPGKFAVAADPSGAVFSVMHLHNPD